MGVCFVYHGGKSSVFMPICPAWFFFVRRRFFFARMGEKRGVFSVHDANVLELGSVGRFRRFTRGFLGVN